jgi:uracil-DNA glycosylase
MQHALLEKALELTDVSWQPIVRRGLAAVAAADPVYIEQLAQDVYLPTQHRLFAAFAQPLDLVRYVLVGEGPYPREQSATDAKRPKRRTMNCACATVSPS